jgi:hypothetical protein
MGACKNDNKFNEHMVFATLLQLLYIKPRHGILEMNNIKLSHRHSSLELVPFFYQ